MSTVTKCGVKMFETKVELLKEKKTLVKEDSQKISKGEIFLLKKLNLKDTGETFEIQLKNEKFTKRYKYWSKFVIICQKRVCYARF